MGQSARARFIDAKIKIRTVIAIVRGLGFIALGTTIYYQDNIVNYRSPTR
jgi:hypothetical protein